MIQIESVHIQEVRGIRDLQLNMERRNFVVSGPNGSGKSGVVDAIQFALTGEISRLSGMGTGELSLSTHGPHVDKRDYPDAAQVRLDVFFPGLNKSASITRKIKKHRKPTIEPNEKAIVEAFAEAATHPEVILSRREIIKFILTEATQRSRDVQTLLKLESIDDTRATLKTTENRLNSALAKATGVVDSAADSLRRHVDLAELTNEQVLESVNTKRSVLGLAPLEDLADAEGVTKGVTEVKGKQTEAQSKETCLRDIEALLKAGTNEESSRTTVASLLAGLDRLKQEPNLLSLIQRRSFLQAGFDLIEEESCPLCDTEWSIDELQAHVKQKIEACDDAQAVKTELLRSGQSIRTEATALKSLVDAVRQVKEVTPELLAQLSEWSGSLTTFVAALDTVEGLLSQHDRLQAGWQSAPKELSQQLAGLTAAVQKRPAKSETDSATEFLILARERLEKYQEAKRVEKRKRLFAKRGKTAYKTYCEIAEAKLISLYDDVQGAFVDHYRLINQDDESGFVAKFEPEQGKLGLLVDFYEKGMFPPAAYHSEGHQDGMGLCLYLALMSHVLKQNFAVAVLDDVVMSVDSKHRKQVCKLLKSTFPETQFIITTHDRVWAQQMRTEGLVRSKNAVAFHSWNVDTGPILEEVTEVWEKIDQHLAKNDVPAAAHMLRRHMEFVSNQLADELGAKVPFRGDGSYDMGDLLQAVIGQQGELLKKANKAARSWNNQADIDKVKALQDQRSDIMKASNGEQWIINKAVHYNEWADLSVDDFRPVVVAFRDLLNQFRCDNCDSWVAPTPGKKATDLRCHCGQFHLNLREKS